MGTRPGWEGVGAFRWHAGQQAGASWLVPPTGCSCDSPENPAILQAPIPPGAGRGIPPCHLVKISRWKSDGNVPTEMLSLLGGGVIQCVPPSSAQVSKGKPDVNNTTF